MERPAVSCVVQVWTAAALCMVLSLSDSPLLIVHTHLLQSAFICWYFLLQASDIQARTVLLTWSPPSSFINGEVNETTVPELCSYEILVSSTGKDGKYRSVYV